MDTMLKWIVMGRNKSTTAITPQSCPNQCLEISLAAAAGNRGKDKVHQMLFLGWDDLVESVKCTLYADARKSS